MAKRGRPRGSKNGAGVRPPRRFALRFDHDVWYVQQGKQWRPAREISLLAAVITSPTGVLYGEGIVTQTGPQTFVVTA